MCCITLVLPIYYSRGRYAGDERSETSTMGYDVPHATMSKLASSARDIWSDR